MPSAANAAQFYPLVTNDPGFVRWAHRIALRLSKLPPNAPGSPARGLWRWCAKGSMGGSLGFLMNAALLALRIHRVDGWRGWKLFQGSRGSACQKP